jgi:hypothetical protein
MEDKNLNEALLTQHDASDRPTETGSSGVSLIAERTNENGNDSKRNNNSSSSSSGSSSQSHNSSSNTSGSSPTTSTATTATAPTTQNSAAAAARLVEYTVPWKTAAVQSQQQQQQSPPQGHASRASTTLLTTLESIDTTTNTNAVAVRMNEEINVTEESSSFSCQNNDCYPTNKNKSEPDEEEESSNYFLSEPSVSEEGEESSTMYRPSSHRTRRSVVVVHPQQQQPAAARALGSMRHHNDRTSTTTTAGGGGGSSSNSNEAAAAVDHHDVPVPSRVYCSHSGVQQEDDELQTRRREGYHPKANRLDTQTTTSDSGVAISALSSTPPPSLQQRPHAAPLHRHHHSNHHHHPFSNNSSSPGGNTSLSSWESSSPAWPPQQQPRKQVLLQFIMPETKRAAAARLQQQQRREQQQQQQQQLGSSSDLDSNVEPMAAALVPPPNHLISARSMEDDTQSLPSPSTIQQPLLKQPRRQRRRPTAESVLPIPFLDPQPSSFLYHSRRGAPVAVAAPPPPAQQQQQQTSSPPPYKPKGGGFWRRGTHFLSNLRSDTSEQSVASLTSSPDHVRGSGGRRSLWHPMATTAAAASPSPLIHGMTSWDNGPLVASQNNSRLRTSQKLQSSHRRPFVPPPPPPPHPVDKVGASEDSHERPRTEIQVPPMSVTHTAAAASYNETNSLVLSPTSGHHAHSVDDSLAMTLSDSEYYGGGVGDDGHGDSSSEHAFLHHSVLPPPPPHSWETYQYDTTTSTSTRHAPTLSWSSGAPSLQTTARPQQQQLAPNHIRHATATTVHTMQQPVLLQHQQRGHRRNRSGDDVAAQLATGSAAYKGAESHGIFYPRDNTVQDDDDDLQYENYAQYPADNQVHNRTESQWRAFHQYARTKVPSASPSQTRTMAGETPSHSSANPTTSVENDSRQAWMNQMALLHDQTATMDNSQNTAQAFQESMSSIRRLADEDQSTSGESEHSHSESDDDSVSDRDVSTSRLEILAQNLDACRSSASPPQFRPKRQSLSPLANIGKKSAERAPRSSFLPTVTYEANDPDHPTFVCPRCKTRQREFFTVENAAGRLEGPGSYLALYFAIYVICSLFIFGLEEGWMPLDCTYFAVITLTTAGLVRGARLLPLCLLFLPSQLMSVCSNRRIISRVTLFRRLIRTKSFVPYSYTLEWHVSGFCWDRTLLACWMIERAATKRKSKLILVQTVLESKWLGNSICGAVPQNRWYLIVSLAMYGDTCPSDSAPTHHPLSRPRHFCLLATLIITTTTIIHRHHCSPKTIHKITIFANPNLTIPWKTQRWTSWFIMTHCRRRKCQVRCSF